MHEVVHESEKSRETSRVRAGQEVELGAVCSVV